MPDNIIEQVCYNVKYEKIFTTTPRERGHTRARRIQKGKDRFMSENEEPQGSGSWLAHAAGIYNNWQASRIQALLGNAA